jgi:hypothetical protein
METKSKAFQRLVVVGYLGLTLLFIVIYFLSGYLPESAASLATLLQDVALNLAIALTISFGSYVLLRPLIEDSNRKTLEDFQAKALDLLTLEKGVREAGVVRIYETLDDVLLQERLSCTKERVCFLSIWMDTPETRLGKNLVELLNRGVSIKILQANPSSEICKVRADSQKALFPDSRSYEPAFIANVIEANNAYFRSLMSESGGTLEVRLFEIMPPFSMVLIDDSAFVSFYGLGKRAATTPHIEFRFNRKEDEFSHVAEFILSQFATLWEHAKPI